MAEHGFRKFIITVTVITAAVIELIDTSIVNVGLSDMSGNLGATLEDVAWVVTAYAIANVIIIPMTSFLAAKFGRRAYYIGSILLFTAASVACGAGLPLVGRRRVRAPRRRRAVRLLLPCVVFHFVADFPFRLINLELPG